VRGSTLVERNKEYVQAARVIGRHPLAIMFAHVLPNVLGPVLVIGTLQIGAAIITESSLSFLGVGGPPTQRNESDDSVMIAAPICSVPITSTGPNTFGRTCANMMAN